MDAEATDRVDEILREWRVERPELDTSPIGVIGRLHRIALALTERLVAVYAQHGLSEAEFDLLVTIRRSGAPYERAAGELAAHTMVTTGGLTKRVDRLALRGLVERVPSDADARRRPVRLTPAGLSLIDRAFEAHLQNEHAILAELGAADTALIEGVLSRWLPMLERG